MERALAARSGLELGNEVRQANGIKANAATLVGCTGRFAGLSGRWTLDAGCAITRHAKQAGVLQIDHGRVWVTFMNAKNPLVQASDYFLNRGDRMELSAGDAVLIEPFAPVEHVPSASCAQFSWMPVWAMRAKRVQRVQRHTEVAKPLADLRRALRLAAGASWRLLGGLAGSVAAVFDSALRVDARR